MKPLGVGVIGMGWMGEVHSRAYLNAGLHFPAAAARLVVCADFDAARAAKAAATFGFARRAADWREAVNDPEVDLVAIAAPNHLHLEIVRAAAAAGKNIFCEKPVGRAPEETAAAAAAARDAGVLTLVGYNYRWAPMVRHAHHLANSGALGKITHFRGRFFSMYGSDPQGLLTWRFKREIAGLGALGDIFSHAADLALWLAGPIARVCAHRKRFIETRPIPKPGASHYAAGGADDPRGEVENEDYAGALLQFANGAVGALEACRVMMGPKARLAFEIHGERGAAEWDFERMNELRFFRPAADGYALLQGGAKYPGHLNPGDGIGLGFEDLKTIEAAQFIASIRKGEQAAPGFDDAARVAALNAAIIKSWASEKWEDVCAP